MGKWWKFCSSSLGKKMRHHVSKRWNIRCFIACAVKWEGVGKLERWPGVAEQGWGLWAEAELSWQLTAGTELSVLEPTHNSPSLPFALLYLLRKHFKKTASTLVFPPRSMAYDPCSLSGRPAHTLKPHRCCAGWGFLSAIWSLILKVWTWYFQKVKWSKTWLARKRVIRILQS